MGGVFSAEQKAYWLPVEVDRPWQDVWTSSPFARMIAKGNASLETTVDTALRSAFAAGAFALILQSIIFKAGDGVEYLQYLTDLTLVLGCAGSLFGFALHLCLRFLPSLSQSEKTSQQPWYAATIWVFKTVGVDVTFFTFLLFWLLVYSPENYTTSLSLYKTSLWHGVIWVCLLFEWIFATDLPFRPQHVIYSVGWGIIYLFISLIHYGVTGGYIYAVLDWGGAPGLAAGLFLIILFVALPLLHAGHLGLLYVTRGCAESAAGAAVSSGGEAKAEREKSKTSKRDLEAATSGAAAAAAGGQGEPTVGGYRGASGDSAGGRARAQPMVGGWVGPPGAEALPPGSVGKCGQRAGEVLAEEDLEEGDAGVVEVNVSPVPAE
uniref:Uncharacterized protein n=1 Tax=Chromera velia CCMP2878 TaxID=1169474 RepID=A0A0G4H8Y7_9ALVE|eukprot:Cvel_876.t1-p1 / transcript=Cvel_876.t1 / gene=Cvel_876 / organism=Chromera_velia_CCMP2878 / gene_product=hypothetical protein / transcript_product=hypothetical protein / location=Cvel_scaffold27:129917-134738(+) / protein_length=377 / sequence_SO=supercontig / SO=protein_coding / is_pseudo=false